jgi:hypothetical protein
MAWWAGAQIDFTENLSASDGVAWGWEGKGPIQCLGRSLSFCSHLDYRTIYRDAALAYSSPVGVWIVRSGPDINGYKETP